MRILLFLSYSFGIETTNKCVYTFLYLIPVYTRYQTKMGQKPYP